MADEIDRAQALETVEREESIAEVRRRQVEGDWREVSAPECLDCGDPIPEARRRIVVGVQRCAECEARREWRVEFDRRTRGW